MTMPPIVFWILVILLTLGAIGSFIVLVSILGHWFFNRGKALDFVGKWYCQYNSQEREVSVNGAVDLWSSAIIRWSGSITEDDGTRHYLNPPERIGQHLLLSNRHVLEFRDKDISVSSEKVNIKINIWLRNGIKKTLDCGLPVILVGRNVSTPDTKGSQPE